MTATRFTFLSKVVSFGLIAGALALGCAGSGGDHNTRLTTLYSMTNSASGNEVVAWTVGPTGGLTNIGQFSTQGNGTGPNEVPLSGPVDGADPLASQGSVSLSADKRYLYAVNAGSNTVSSFRVGNRGDLTFINSVTTGGTSPVSVASDGSHAYVVNVNDPPMTPSTITAYSVGSDGGLTLVLGGTHNLNAVGARPSQVLINPAGTFAIVPERGTDTINVFPILSDGDLGSLIVTPSAGPGPFGALMDGNTLIVSEVAGGASGQASTSSYTLNVDGTLTVVSAQVVSGETAACWVSLVPGGTNAYVSNTGSGSVTNYGRTSNGTLSIAQSAVSVTDDTSQPIDAVLSDDGTHLYQLLGARGTVAVFDVDNQGNLTFRNIQDTGVLPVLGSQGLAIR